jgi:hypothetical protein
MYVHTVLLFTSNAAEGHAVPVSLTQLNNPDFWLAGRWNNFPTPTPTPIQGMLKASLGEDTLPRAHNITLIRSYV